MSEPLVIDLPYPAKELSPNARVHPMTFARFKKKAKQDAFWATKTVIPISGWQFPDGRIPLRMTFHPVQGKAAKDVDNYVASEKARIDGVAEALKVDDKLFDVIPVLGDPKPRGGVTYEIGGQA